MATYKVLQDIESEDKLLGTLTLRQFIYAAIVALSLFIMFKLAAVNWLLIIPLIPHTLLLSVLAAPIGKDQSPEIWLLARIRFMLKPQLRIWDQSGLKQLVTITVPKKVEQHLTNGLSQIEVKSRLEALANTIDSRGWAVKNVNVNLFAQPSYVLNQVDSDRLIDPGTIPQQVPAYDPQAFEDVLDERTSPTAQHFDQLISTSQQAHRQQVVAQMKSAASAAPTAQPNYWFMNSAPQVADPGKAAFANPAVIAPGTNMPTTTPQLSKQEEEALLSQIHPEDNMPRAAYGHMRVIEPASSQKKKSAQKGKTTDHPKEQPAQPTNREDLASPAAVDPAILELASRNDLNVATIARQAEKAKKRDDDNEVVISLR
jgi:hypothetical protein